MQVIFICARAELCAPLVEENLQAVRPLSRITDVFPRAVTSYDLFSPSRLSGTPRPLRAGGNDALPQCAKRARRALVTVFLPETEGLPSFCAWQGRARDGLRHRSSPYQHP